MSTNVPTRHNLVITVDPAMSVVMSTPEGLTLPGTDADPEKAGRALLLWVKTARKIALAEMAEEAEKRRKGRLIGEAEDLEVVERPTSGDAVESLLDADTDIPPKRGGDQWST